MPQIVLPADLCNQIYFQSILDYHQHDNIDATENNPYNPNEQYIQNLLYKKNWIDTVQWHLEDVIRSPDINPAEGMLIKRRIDLSNQHRNDTVEKIDEWLYQSLYPLVTTRKQNARMNSESPAWILDRMSILCLKIFHMEKEVERTDADDNHKMNCSGKLNILREQISDLSRCFEELQLDIIQGDKYMKVYRQMKMYNDPEMNPVLYKNVRK